jgi:hypothetical protein
MIRLALENDRQANKEFYDTRANTAGQLDNLFNSIDLSGGLSATEREEISRALAQEGAMRGNGMAPSNLDTVGNAMQFGDAGRRRQLANQGMLVSAINSATNFLPASKSGIDTFQVATGNTSRPNAGNALFGGIAAPAGNSVGNVAGQSYGSASSKTGNQSGPVNKDQPGKMQGIGQIAGAALSLFCHTARVCIPNDWVYFYAWKENCAPKWFYKLYNKYTKQLAAWLYDKPRAKAVVSYCMMCVVKNFKKKYKV